MLLSGIWPSGLEGYHRACDPGWVIISGEWLVGHGQRHQESPQRWRPAPDLKKKEKERRRRVASRRFSSTGSSLSLELQAALRLVLSENIDLSTEQGDLVPVTGELESHTRELRVGVPIAWIRFAKAVLDLEILWLEF